jgi:hypothetical protein
MCFKEKDFVQRKKRDKEKDKWSVGGEHIIASFTLKKKLLLLSVKRRNFILVLNLKRTKGLQQNYFLDT